MLAIIVPNKIGNGYYMIVYGLGKAQNLTKKIPITKIPYKLIFIMKYATFSFLLTILTHLGYTQDSSYINMISSNRVWSESYDLMIGFGGNNTTIYFLQDSIEWNGKSYVKLYRSDRNFFSIGLINKVA